MKYGIDVYCIGSEGQLSKDLAENFGFNYLEVANNPLSNKINKGLQHLKGKGYDGVVVVGSDNFLSDSIFEHYLQADTSINAVYGFNDLHFYSTHEKKLGTKGAYQHTGMTIGVARMFTKELLEKANYSLWRTDLNSGLDGSSNGVIKSLGAKEIKINYTDNFFLLDVKHEMNITRHEILKTCTFFPNIVLIKKYCPSIYDDLMALNTEQKQLTIKRQKVMKRNNKRATVSIEILKNVAGMTKGEIKTVAKEIGSSGQIAGWCKILPASQNLENKSMVVGEKVLIKSKNFEPKKEVKKTVKKVKK